MRHLNNKSKIIGYILLILYIAFISYFAFISKIAGRTELHRNQYNLIPLYSIKEFFSMTGFNGARGFVINILGNIIVFMPVGFLALYLFYDKIKSKSLVKVTIIGFLFSLSVESIQWFMSVGVFDVDDLILNTLGAVLGMITYRMINNRICKPVKGEIA